MQARAPETTPYPADALAWLAGDPAVDGSRTVLCAGAPVDAALRDALAVLGHDVRTDGAAGTLPDDSVDVVVATHGAPADLDETVRVLRPGGRAAWVVPERDTRIPWVRKLDRILAPADPATDPATDPTGIATHGAFDEVESHAVRFWQQVDRPTLLETVARWPELHDLPEVEREERLAAVGALYDDYGRGPDGMLLPWVAHCHRARLVDRPAGSTQRPVPPLDPSGESSESSSAIEPGHDLAADTDMLLIDFR